MYIYIYRQVFLTYIYVYISPIGNHLLIQMYPYPLYTTLDWKGKPAKHK